jgi:hypothetical protein
MQGETNRFLNTKPKSKGKKWLSAICTFCFGEIERYFMTVPAESWWGCIRFQGRATLWRRNSTWCQGWCRQAQPRPASATCSAPVCPTWRRTQGFCPHCAAELAHEKSAVSSEIKMFFFYYLYLMVSHHWTVKHTHTHTKYGNSWNADKSEN